MSVAIVLGTRPEIMKNYSLVKALRGAGARYRVLHTNQHADYDMQGAFFAQMGYAADAVLPTAYAFGRAVDWVQQQLEDFAAKVVIVNGDTAAALVGAVAGIYAGVKVAHVEAGLRSLDRRMREERNRVMVDNGADYLFAYTDAERDYLRSSPDIRGEVFLSGNTTVDLIHDFADRLARPRPDRFAYVTLHRKEFTDHPLIMEQVFSTLAMLAEDLPVVFPMHPRTRRAMQQHGLDWDCLGNVDVVGPLPAFDSLSYEKHAEVVITDSGCMQEEAYLFNVPCVTVRENTERHGTLVNGANILSGFEPRAILNAIDLQRSQPKMPFPDLYGTTGAGERIIATLSGRGLVEAVSPAADGCVPLRFVEHQNGHAAPVVERSHRAG
jgi:UDP-N-acetylglucosamine 2-epimerase (non-hydrolysing)